MNEPCPVCGLSGGFHQKHDVTIPQELLKEKGWQKMSERKKIVVYTTITVQSEAIWPDHYDGETLAEAIAFEQNQPEQEIIENAIQTIEFSGPTAVIVNVGVSEVEQ